MVCPYFIKYLQFTTALCIPTILVVKCVIVASPGFLKEQFFDYMCQQATKEEKRVLLDNKSKFTLIHSSSGHKHALKEILTDPIVMSKIANTKAAGEINALNDFYQMLKTDPSRAFYGCVGNLEL